MLYFITQNKAAFQDYNFGVLNILKNKNEEIEIIKTMAKNNNYNTEIIGKIIKVGKIKKPN